MSINNYRFNIAKDCPICGKGFITDIFEEKTMCNSCESVYTFSEYEEDSDTYYIEGVKDVIDSVVNNASCRTSVYRYD